MSIRRRGKDRWEIAVDLPHGQDGKQERRFETVKGTKKDAQRRRSELLTDLGKGIYASPGKLTVAEFLRSWLPGHVATNCPPRTLDSWC